MTKAGFGEHLKREREMRGVSLDEICSATRIGTRFLVALESEEWELLPGGVFNRGFVRAISRYLGLDEEGMIAEYVMAINEGDNTPSWARQEPPLTPKSWRPWMAAAMILILAAAGWLSWHFYSAHRAQKLAVRPAATALTETPLAAEPSQGASNVGDPRPAGKVVPDATGTLMLKIEAGKATSVEVSADGAGVFEGNMIAGQNRMFEAQNEFDVSAQDGGALLLQLNGQTLAPIGPPGRSGKVKLTRRDLKTSGGGTD
jgi:cytoskeleton protein RodZ